MISKVDSTQLRGAAITLVLQSLMLSGYGLVKSYLQSGLNGFLLTRTIIL